MALSPTTNCPSLYTPPLSTSLGQKEAPHTPGNNLLTHSTDTEKY